ncbi:CBS domain-containing protein [Sporosalibacterium faouarense]|uniref:CBS domain-containing protein n=1 Tax=Sporosalibacterium faouarense TaxID=516123 RepID=UPI00141C2CBF|nr:CBS domain-containing protein [Sporosalibacterium faouarense]MTI48659.1 CBS domain-containing protein [Bacillota bacterium]
MQARDIMTKEVISVNEENTVEEVLRIIVENKISGVPVVDEDNKVKGIVSESDLMFKDRDISSPPFIPIFEGFILLESIKKFEEKLRKKVAYKVKDIMTKPVIKVEEHEEVHEIANIMLEKQVNRVPVVDEEGRLVGIVSRSDILKSF